MWEIGNLHQNLWPKSGRIARDPTYSLMAQTIRLLLNISYFQTDLFQFLMVVPRDVHPRRMQHARTHRSHGIKGVIKCGRKAFSVCQSLSILHLNSSIRLLTLWYGGYRIFLGLNHSKEEFAHSHRTLNMLDDEIKRWYFFSCSWPSDSKCMVYILKKYFYIQLM